MGSFTRRSPFGNWKVVNKSNPIMLWRARWKNDVLSSDLWICTLSDRVYQRKEWICHGKSEWPAFFPTLICSHLFIRKMLDQITILIHREWSQNQSSNTKPTPGLVVLPRISKFLLWKMTEEEACCLHSFSVSFEKTIIVESCEGVKFWIDPLYRRLTVFIHAFIHSQ